MVLMGALVLYGPGYLMMLNFPKPKTAGGNDSDWFLILYAAIYHQYRHYYHSSLSTQVTHVHAVEERLRSLGTSRDQLVPRHNIYRLRTIIHSSNNNNACSTEEHISTKFQERKKDSSNKKCTCILSDHTQLLSMDRTQLLQVIVTQITCRHGQTKRTYVARTSDMDFTSANNRTDSTHWTPQACLVSFPDPLHGKEGSGRVAIGKLSKWNVIIYLKNVTTLRFESTHIRSNQRIWLATTGSWRGDNSLIAMRPNPFLPCNGSGNETKACSGLVLRAHMMKHRPRFFSHKLIP